MKYLNHAITLATSLLFMGGCATSDCDPSRGGFIRGIGCSVSGSYEAREANLRHTRDAAELERQRSQRSYDETSRQVEATKGELAAAEREYEALDRDLAALRTKLSKSKVANEELKRKVSELEQEMKLLKADSFTPQSEKDRHLEQLRKQLTELQRQVAGAL